jgi:hypothetical protein
MTTVTINDRVIDVVFNVHPTLAGAFLPAVTAQDGAIVDDATRQAAVTAAWQAAPPVLPTTTENK